MPAEINCYEELLESLKQALAYERGDKTHCRVDILKVPDTNGNEDSKDEA